MNNTINGKTPDEIKKGLECCLKLKTNCSLCPYAPNVDGDCMNGLVPDALAYIQQLERERDAAVGLVKELGTCNCCKHDSFCPHTIPDCMNCKDIRCPCYSCGHQSNWQWRGVQKEVE